MGIMGAFNTTLLVLNRERLRERVSNYIIQNLDCGYQARDILESGIY